MRIEIITAFTVDEIDGKRGRRSFKMAERPDDVSDAFMRMAVGKGLARRLADPVPAEMPSVPRRSKKSRTG